MNTSPKVLVIGAGPSGLVAALTLLRNGITVRIVDKGLEAHPGQRGAGIMPRSLELFERLGVLHDILKEAIPAPPVRRYALGSAHILHEAEMVPRVEPTPDIPHPNIFLLGQNRLEPILSEAISKFSGEIERGTEVVSFEQSDHGVVVNLIKHGVPESATYDYVIGADGARSVVRKLSQFAFQGETRPAERLVVGDIQIGGLSENYWHMWGASDIMISVRPTNVFGVFNVAINSSNHSDHDRLSASETAFKQFVQKYIRSEASELVFGEVSWLSLFTPNIRMVEKFQLGRVLLVGDAGHVHSPTGGQGMNSSVQDAFNLAWKLSLVIRNEASPSLLDTYSEERIPVIKEMLFQTTQLHNKAFVEKANDAFKRGSTIRQLGINYRWSSIVLDERKGAGAVEEISAYGGHYDGFLRAGDRAPDASGLADLSATRQSENGRLFDLFGPTHHTVLVFAPALEQYSALAESVKLSSKGRVQIAVILKTSQDKVISWTDADAVLEDREEHAHNGYKINDDFGVVVVRPDGVVGAIVGGADGLGKCGATESMKEMWRQVMTDAKNMPKKH
ncbi:hypothetical protein DXG03_009369 [Asterophora parasitica]|uniref:FAD-binding domain-containing protein n=1 Tax=Asterophora parasitica TaxID=117018 RepID=A0A9P7GBG4_9AGAR|nr:hypothetical protein DXG03_009369 [Asterophora parasitica]